MELTPRIASFGSRPQDFFRSGWNVFDFTVIAASFTLDELERELNVRDIQ